MSPILNTQTERRWVTEALSDRSGAVHDRVLGYLHAIDTIGSVIDSLQRDRASEAHKRQLLQAAVEAMLAWPNSEDPALGCEQATAQARSALMAAGESPAPSYTEEEIRNAVKHSGTDSHGDVIEYLCLQRTTR